MEKERQTFVDHFYHYFFYCLCDSDPSCLLFTLYINLTPKDEGSRIAPMLYPKNSRNQERPERQAIERSKGEVSTRSLTSRSQSVPVKSPPFYLT